MEPDKGTYTPSRTSDHEGPWIRETIQKLVYTLLRRIKESSYSRRMPNTRFDNLRQLLRSWPHFLMKLCHLVPSVTGS
jgi:hypothetical protein